MNKNDLRIIFAVPSLSCEYLGIGLLASCLRKKGFHNITVAACSIDAIEVQLRGISRAVLAFSTFAPFSRELKDTAREIKRRHRDLVIVAGGAYATFVPELVMEDGIDGVCLGEAEEAFPEFVEQYYMASALPVSIRNWWVKDASGCVFRNDLRPPCADLDSFPFAARDLVPKAWFVRKGVRRFSFTRGCPYQCSYCTVASFPKAYQLKPHEYLRMRSAASAVDEIKRVVQEHGCRIVSIADAIMGADIQWLREFAPRFRREVGLPFYCNSEVRFINEEYVLLLKQAGCYLVLLGFETADDGVRKDVLAKNFQLEDFRRAVALMRRHKIKVGVYSMIGIPGGNLEQDLQTLRINQEINADFPTARVFSFFPGTRLYDEYCAKGVSPDKSFSTVRNVYWPVISDKRVRKDLDALLRLHCLFTFCVYFKIPLPVVRFMVGLPFQYFYRLIAKCTFIFQYGRWY